MTNDATRCPYYIQESQNVKSRWTCVIPKNITDMYQGRFEIPNNKEDCEVGKHTEFCVTYDNKKIWGKCRSDCTITMRKTGKIYKS